MKYNIHKEKHYNLHTINVSNFRSCHLALIFNNKFSEKDAVAFSLLSDILTDSSTTFKTSKYVNRFMEENHILDFYGSFSKSGNDMKTYIVCDYVDPKYIKTKNYINKVYDFIFKTISNPIIIDDAFDEKNFNVAKKRLVSSLESLDENNSFKSVHKAISIACTDSTSKFHLYDMIDFIKQFTKEDIVKYYKKLITESSIDIFVTGSTDDKTVKSLVKKCYPFKNKEYKKTREYIENKPRRIPKKVLEKSSFKQSTVVMVYNINNLTSFEKEFVMPYYLNILNTSGLNSKLYKSLREKNSLCYSVNTSFNSLDNIMIVKSTIRTGSERKAINLIKKCVVEMKSKISKNEYTNAYYAYKTSLKGMVDSIGAINRLYMNKYYLDFSDYETKEKKYKTVSIDNIYDIAKKPKLNTIYVLKGDKNERNQD